MKLVSLLFITSSLFLFIGCQQEEDTSHLIEGEGIQVEGTWARPGSEGRMSAAYFLITNFEEQADTLVSVESDISQLVEIHESYKQDEDMVGMREVGSVEIPGESTVRFEQGGLHIMLIQLNQRLSDGDSFELTLNFANHDNITLEIPVRR